MVNSCKPNSRTKRCSKKGSLADPKCKLNFRTNRCFYEQYDGYLPKSSIIFGLKNRLKQVDSKLKSIDIESRQIKKQLEKKEEYIKSANNALVDAYKATNFLKKQVDESNKKNSSSNEKMIEEIKKYRKLLRVERNECSKKYRS